MRNEVLRDAPRDILIFVNNEQKMRLPTDIPLGELYLIVPPHTNSDFLGFLD